MAIGFPKGPGKRSKEPSRGRKRGAAELSEGGTNGGQSTAPPSGNSSLGHSWTATMARTWTAWRGRSVFSGYVWHEVVCPGAVQ